MQVAEIELYEILKPKIGEKEARTLVEYIETKVDRKLEERKDVLATKEDIANLRAATKEDIAYLKQDIANLEIKLEKTRADIIKWMFLFWIGQLASLIAILELFFKR
ncbi:MAG: hypothetical protein CO106_10670 [Deltaproteobacteria bacterium CG_4_9_14_3_um_filter_44_9]|nr:MAG: hypothetical protein AUK23_11240 [Deltaproteobacteria bacterium CG2_30_43_15]PIU85098.1 MAG: hypothetical protein COS67_09705 [Deltaproteobacteria bacterium CG06_land_8_20_14_3_00_44_19]PIX23343.1 MAG: hypothetical protein COZ68_09700 [Deltaproteobacteria bacterium CG_4_8_14_3_um_filter_43_13]PIZ19094.1 MAG: hypothetical protein COY50_11905 [Deltaproteobacteria bacterium CG_4_10_14_0_8_um_filter_43_12]PJB39681.1 MAG: hypothetical protein CO106_10670 [Deltaproteobacteria bacterium CG_4_9